MNKVKRSVRPRKPTKDSPSYEMILQNLQSNGKDWGFSPIAVGVTGTVAGEGATTVAANLAATAASTSSSERVLLVDANLTKPGAARMLKMRPAKTGLAEVLAGDAELSDCIQDTAIERLSLLCPGNDLTGFQSASSRSLEAFMEHLKYEFPLVIVDVPTGEKSGNGLALATSLDGLLMVVTEGRLPRDQIRQATRRIQRCGGNLLGVVLNKVAR